VYPYRFLASSAPLQALAANAYVRALLIALRLGDTSLLQHAILSTPPSQVVPTAKQLPPMFLQVRGNSCGADMWPFTQLYLRACMHAREHEPLTGKGPKVHECIGVMTTSLCMLGVTKLC
jgi:hypothetical protein